MAQRRLIYPSGLGQNPDGPAPPAPAAGDTEPQSWSPPSPPRSISRRGFSAALLAAVTNFSALEAPEAPPVQDGSEAAMIRALPAPLAVRPPAESAALLEDLTAGQDDLAWAEISQRPEPHPMGRRPPGEAAALLEDLTAGQDDLAWSPVHARPPAAPIGVRPPGETGALLEDLAAAPAAGDDVFAPAPRVASRAVARHLEPGAGLEALTAGQDDLAWSPVHARPPAAPIGVRPPGETGALLEDLAAAPAAGNDVFAPDPRVIGRRHVRHLEPGAGLEALTAGQDDLAWSPVYVRPAAPPIGVRPPVETAALLEQLGAAGDGVEWSATARPQFMVRGARPIAGLLLDPLPSAFDGGDDSLLSRPARAPRARAAVELPDLERPLPAEDGAESFIARARPARSRFHLRALAAPGWTFEPAPAPLLPGTVTASLFGPRALAALSGARVVASLSGAIAAAELKP